MRPYVNLILHRRHQLQSVDNHQPNLPLLLHRRPHRIIIAITEIKAVITPRMPYHRLARRVVLLPGSHPYSERTVHM
jgi:hypothetical protein